MVCDRCSRDDMAWTMSMFNLEQICMDCKERERKHPSYSLAAAEEYAACQRGDYNFPGIGRPVDL